MASEPRFYVAEYDGSICHTDGKGTEVLDESQVADLLNTHARELAEAREEIERHLEDLQLAAGELLIDVPEPGSDMARMMRANRLMRREIERLRGQRDRLAASTRGLLDACPPEGEIIAEVREARAALASMEEK